MSEIEMMYENCNIKPKQEGYCDWDSDCPYPDIINDGCGDECPYWKYEDKAKYPPFTAEKQLALIKWLARKQYAKYTTSLLVNIRDTVRFSGGLIAGVCTLNVKYDKQDKDFKNALAGLINEMWQDLTEEEKQQIKEILE